jgi:putative NADH-flavin reductase
LKDDCGEPKPNQVFAWTKRPEGSARGSERLGPAALVEAHDALISAFNPGWTPGTVKPEMYDQQVRGTSSIIAAARKAGIQRVLWVGGAGGLEVAPGVRAIDAPGFPEWIKPGSRATSAALDQLQKLPELDWSFLAPSAKLEPGNEPGNSD